MFLFIIIHTRLNYNIVMILIKELMFLILNLNCNHTFFLFVLLLICLQFPVSWERAFRGFHSKKSIIYKTKSALSYYTGVYLLLFIDLHWAVVHLCPVATCWRHDDPIADIVPVHSPSPPLYLYWQPHQNSCREYILVII